MAQVSKPSKLPRWADVPPVAPPTTITEPSEPEKDVGDQPGSPIRQYANWFKNLVYQWLGYLSATAFSWADIGSDWVDTFGDKPTIGSGLVGTSGAGPAYIQGVRVAGTNEAHTYGASKDTYVDLDYQNVWHYSQVANGAGAPSATANAIRMFKVVTGLTDRTSVVDLRDARAKVRKPIRFGHTIYVGEDTDRDAGEPATVFHYNPGRDYALRDEVDSFIAGDGPSLRTYQDTNGAPVITHNARWDEASALWTADKNGDASLYHVTSAGTLNVRRYPSATVASPWNDASWPNRDVAIDFAVGLGGSALTPALWADPTSDTGQRRLILDGARPGTTGERMRIYSSITGTGFGPCLEITTNAAWSGTQWARDISALAAKIQIGYLGVQHLQHAAADPSTWSDAISGGAWSDAFSSLQKASYYTFSGGDASYVGAFAADFALPLLYTQVVNTAPAAWIPLHLPNGAVIVAARIYGQSSTSGLEVAILRKAVFSDQTTAAESMRAGGTPYDAFPTAGSASAFDMTIDAASNIRTVDNSAYAYGFMAVKTSTGNGYVYGGRIAYTIQPYAT